MASLAIAPTSLPLDLAERGQLVGTPPAHLARGQGTRSAEVQQHQGFVPGLLVGIGGCSFDRFFMQDPPSLHEVGARSR